MLFGTLIRALAAAVLTTSVWWAATPAQAQTDWQHCANEGQTCRFTGEALVRFGAGERYAFGVMRDGAVCDTTTFGDPANGVAKRCEFSRQWRHAEAYRGWRRRPGTEGAAWRFCADEGRLCDTGGRSVEVRFGANDRYVTRTASGQVDCSIDRFGDPAPGLRKRCEVRDEWAWCADERERCQAPAGAEVRYGAVGRHVTRQVNGPVECRNNVFGDPAPGVAKQCEYRVGGSSAGRPGAGPLTWLPCAEEGGACTPGGPTIVRFGDGQRFLYAETDRPLTCDRASFGGSDPAPGQRKRCEALQR